MASFVNKYFGPKAVCYRPPPKFPTMFTPLSTTRERDRQTGRRRNGTVTNCEQ